MLWNYNRYFRAGLVAITLVATPLAGCSTANLAGSSAFGSSKLRVAELPTNVSYTPDGALTNARSHFRNNDFGYSAAYYQKAVELSPNDAEAYIGLGASYDRLGRFDLSDRVYASLFKITGGTTQYYNNIGYSYMLRGNLKAAWTNFRQAEKLDPGNVVIANNLLLLASAAQAGRA